MVSTLYSNLRQQGIPDLDMDWLSNVDLNNYKSTGRFAIQSATNAPEDWGILDVIRVRSDRIVQQFYANSGIAYRRIYRLAGWDSAWEKIPSHAEFTALNNSIVPFLKLTYNSTTGKFEPPANTPKLADAQITFVVRNVQTGAVYVIYYVYSENAFSIAATIHGNAPSNGQNAYIMAVR